MLIASVNFLKTENDFSKLENLEVFLRDLVESPVTSLDVKMNQPKTQLLAE